MAEMRNLAKEEKPKFGQLVNNAKSSITEAIENKLNKLNETLLNEKLARESVDITLNAYKMPKANLHPLTLIQDRLEEIFTGMGYKVVEGPEVELSDYNFTRANIDENHPARDPQDTFYINPSLLLRTQTTAIQMRELEKEGKIGSLHDKYYATVGNGTAVASAKKFAAEIAAKLVNAGVQAVILTST